MGIDGGFSVPGILHWYSTTMLLTKNVKIARLEKMVKALYVRRLIERYEEGGRLSKR